MIYALTDEEMDAVMHLAAPLPAACRARFVEEVLAAASRYGAGEIGAGLLHRIGREMHKTFGTRTPLAPQPAGATRQQARRR